MTTREARLHLLALLCNAMYAGASIKIGGRVLAYREAGDVFIVTRVKDGQTIREEHEAPRDGLYVRLTNLHHQPIGWGYVEMDLRAFLHAELNASIEVFNHPDAYIHVKQQIADLPTPIQEAIRVGLPSAPPHEMAEVILSVMP